MHQVISRGQWDFGRKRNGWAKIRWLWCITNRAAAANYIGQLKWQTTLCAFLSHHVGGIQLVYCNSLHGKYIKSTLHQDMHLYLLGLIVVMWGRKIDLMIVMPMQVLYTAMSAWRQFNWLKKKKKKNFVCFLSRSKTK